MKDGNPGPWASGVIPNDRPKSNNKKERRIKAEKKETERYS
jgi:hypothetical protein